MAYDERNCGIIRKNDKGDNPKRPDYKGSLDVDGVQYWVSGWVRKRNSDGSPFLSIKVEKKEQQNLPPSAAAAASDAAPDAGRGLDSEHLPF